MKKMAPNKSGNHSAKIQKKIFFTDSKNPTQKNFIDKITGKVWKKTERTGPKNIGTKMRKKLLKPKFCHTIESNSSKKLSNN